MLMETPQVETRDSHRMSGGNPIYSKAEFPTSYRKSRETRQKIGGGNIHRIQENL